MFKCDQCDREFNTEQGLAQHMSDKHGVSSHEKKEAKKEERNKEQQTASSGAKRKKTFRNAVIVVVLIAVVAGIAWVAMNYSSDGYVPSLSGGNSIGAENASVVMVEYSDFQCPFCGSFYADAEKQIIETYVDTGKVKFIYKHFPLTRTHAYAQKAAEASECAAEQGKFWEYHNMLFENQNSLYLTSLKSYAATLGLNTTQFDTCLDSGAMQQRVSNDYNEGVSRGVGSTPTFFINDIKIDGARSFSAYQSVIENQLAK